MSLRDDRMQSLVWQHEQRLQAWSLPQLWHLASSNRHQDALKTVLGMMLSWRISSLSKAWVQCPSICHCPAMTLSNFTPYQIKSFIHEPCSIYLIQTLKQVSSLSLSPRLLSCSVSKILSPNVTMPIATYWVPIGGQCELEMRTE